MDGSDELARLERRFARERAARQQAEAIAEQGLRDLYLSQQRAELLQRVSSAAVEGSPLAEVLRLALSGLCAMCGWQIGHLFLVADGALKSAEVWHGTNEAMVERMRQATGQMDPESSKHLPGRVAAKAVPAWITIEEDRHFVRAETARACGLRGAAAFPVLCRGRVIGVAEFFATDPFRPDPVHDDLIAQVLSEVGMVIERQQAEEELLKAKRQLDAALANMSQSLVMFDASGRLTLSNPRFAELYRFDGDLPPGLSQDEVLLRLATSPAGPEEAEQFCAHRRLVSQSGHAAYDVTTLIDGRVVGISHRPMPDGGWVETHEDITETRRVQARLTQLAHFDGLTGLPNRLLFQDRIARALARLNREGGSIGLLCLDLDRFKDVNDTLGHKLGDELLRQVAMRLTGCVRDSDTVARLGGDEFAILQTGDAQPASAVVLARRLTEELALPHELGEHRVVVSASIGIALAPRDGTDADVLMRNADLAMYRAKANGRGAHAFFEASMHEAMQARVALEADLRRGLARDEFAPYYQPIVDTRNFCISGFEALVRWHHPERGLVPPGEFIPLAEEIGLIGALGRAVLRRACRDAAGWPKPVNVSVNISPLQFHGNLLAEVKAALADSGLAPQRLELEITETVLLAESEATLTTLRDIKALGVRIAMDDFGTGYSSLSYLRLFPFDRVKIDQSFVKDLGQRMDTAAIVRAVVNLCHSLGMATTAEGVETEWQLAEIADGSGVSVQGYLFGKPRPPEDVPAILSKMHYDVSTLGVTI